VKVVIGPYRSWIGPYQIAEALCFWVKDTKDEFGIRAKPEWVHNFGTWLAERKDGSDSWLTKACQWIDKKKKRQVYVRIDKFDTWGMDHTLALIVLPMLYQLKATKQGSPQVDDFDCPQHLWSTHAKPRENEWDTDEFWHQRWEYVLGEMIWAFEQYQKDDDTDEFYDHSKVDNNAPLETQVHQIEVDREALNHHEHRKRQALKLFGKYYQALWD
jgi:hypothetical protein